MDDGCGAASARAEILEGLARRRKELSPKYLYDERGSELFERITELPEYYPTRTERALLELWMPAWVGELEPASFVELGAGSARKSRVILEAMLTAECGDLYVPVDVSGAFLRETADELRREYPALRVRPEVVDITQPFRLDTDPPRPVLFGLLGSTLGNFYPEDAVELLGRIRRHMAPGDALLLGVDLRPGPRKSVELLEAAYNDAAGVTAAFNRNVLRVVNRTIGSDFDPGAFEHRARYNPDAGRIEISLRSVRDQTVHVPGEGPLAFPAGEEIRTEVSYKYDRPFAETLLGRADLSVERWEPDEGERFALVLAARARGRGG